MIDDEDEEEKGAEVIFLGRPRAGGEPAAHIGVTIECDDPELKARLEKVVFEALRDPPEEEGGDEP